MIVWCVYAGGPTYVSISLTFFFLSIYLFEADSHYISQVDLELKMFLFQLLELQVCAIRLNWYLHLLKG